MAVANHRAPSRRNEGGAGRLMPFYEDIKVGQRGELGSFTFTAELIKKFAAQFDPQRFHLDEEEGRKSLFGGLTASGWHVAAVCMKLMVAYAQRSGRRAAARGDEVAVGPEHRQLDRREIGQRYCGPTPWRQLASSRSVWLLGLQYVALSYGWYFYVTWLPTYLREARGTSLKMGAVLAGLPLLLGGVGCMISGWVVPRLARVVPGPRRREAPARVPRRRPSRTRRGSRRRRA